MNKFITLSLIGLGLVVGLSQCRYERSYKADAVIADISLHDVTVKTVIPDSLRKSTRDCLITNKVDERIECKEEVKDLTFTHSINERDVLDKSKIHVGNVVSLRLPLLKEKEVEVNKQYVNLSPYEIQVDVPVFLSGVIKGNSVKVKGVYKVDSSPLSTISSDSNYSGVTKVFVPFSYGEPHFYLYKDEGNQIGVYELMTPNVEEDRNGTGSILEEELRDDKILTMNNDLSIAYGIEVGINRDNISSYINSSNIPIPPYKNKTTIDKANYQSNTQVSVQEVHKPPSLRGIMYILFLIGVFLLGLFKGDKILDWI
jgi:hypothetical protein